MAAKTEIHRRIAERMSADQLAMRIVTGVPGMIGRARLSYEELYDMLAVHPIRSRTPEEAASFQPAPRHFIRDKRRPPPRGNSLPRLDPTRMACVRK